MQLTYIDCNGQQKYTSRNTMLGAHKLKHGYAVAACDSPKRLEVSMSWRWLNLKNI